MKGKGGTEGEERVGRGEGRPEMRWKRKGKGCEGERRRGRGVRGKGEDCIGCSIRMRREKHGKEEEEE